MLDLIKDLLVVIQAIGGYTMPATMPEVHIVPDKELQQAACGRPCMVKAFYDPEKGVFLSESVDYAHDTYGRSILLHELVHYAQNVSGRFEASSTPCERRNAEEIDAYEIQNRYLSSQADPRQIPMRMLAFHCD
jgi:hypothetical protein